MGCLRISSTFLKALAMALVMSLLPKQLAAAFPQPGNAAMGTPFHGGSSFLTQRGRLPIFTTCNKYPRVCRAKGSPGPDCCKKRCVNIDRDAMNCGMCGNKCKYLEICCKGKCVSPLKDRKHCGGCGNRCKKGSKCTYGMCSYA